MGDRLVIAVAIAALAGVLLGAPTLRLRGDYLAIVTLGFGEIVPLMFKNLDKVNINIAGNTIIGPNFNLTGGVLGINPIDPPTLPNPFGNEIIFSNSNPHASLYLILLILVVVFFLCRRLRDSRLGRAWMAIREDETAAEAMGINTVSTKLLAFALGASCSGFVGAFVSLVPDRGLPGVVQLRDLDHDPDHGRARGDGQLARSASSARSS